MRSDSRRATEAIRARPSRGSSMASSSSALAVTTERRSALAPDLPPVSEALGKPGFDLAAWVGIFGPARMPAAVSAKLGDALYRIVASPEIQGKLKKMGAEPTPARAQAFGPFVEQQKSVWGEKVRQAGIEAQ